jgi:hypothetical protein
MRGTYFVVLGFIPFIGLCLSLLFGRNAGAFWVLTGTWYELGFIEIAPPTSARSPASSGGAALRP